MDISEIQTQIEELIEGVPSTDPSLYDAQRYAVDFNRAKSHLASLERVLRGNRADMNLEYKVRKAYAFQNAHGSSIPEKKLNAEADTELLNISRDIERTSADISYIERTLKICEDFHTYFRKICG